MFNQLKKWKWALVLLCILIVIGTLVYYFFFRSTATSTRYITATATKGSITQSVTTTGSVLATQQKNYGFRVSGVASELDVKVGDTVKAGQVLAKIDTTDLQAQLAQSQSSLRVAQNNYANRNKNTPNNYDTANLQENVTSAQDKVKSDQSGVDNTILKSAIDGKISAINNQVGDNVNTNAPTNFMQITDLNGNNPRSVNFAVAGKISAIRVGVGDIVKPGQVLAELDSTQAKAQLAQSQSSLRVAQNNYANRNKNTPNNYDTDNLLQSVATAQIKVDSDKKNLDLAVLNSDIDGIVTTVGYSVGDSVSASGTSSSSGSSSSSSSSSSASSSSGSSSSGGSVISVVNLNSLVTSLTFPESDIAKIKTGQSVQLTLDGLGEKQFTGKVQNVDTIGTTSSNVVSYGVKVSFDKLNPDIKPGMTATAVIITDIKDNVLTVSSAAVKTSNGVKTAQVADPATINQSDTKIQPSIQNITVKTGVSNDTETEITDGLNEGDTVITGTIASASTAQSSSSLINLGGGTTGANNRTGGGFTGGTTSRTTTQRTGN